RLPHYLICAGQYNVALSQLDEVEAMTTTQDAASSRREIFLKLGGVENAIQAERQLLISNGESAAQIERDIGAMKAAVKPAGVKVIWRADLNSFIAEGDLYNQAGCYAQLGETEKSLKCLETLFAQHDNVLTFEIMTDWKLDPLRSNPRFHAILAKMH